MGDIVQFIAGSLVGGTLWGYIFGRLAGRWFLKGEEPDAKALKATALGFIPFYILIGWGAGRGFAIDPLAAFYYLPGIFLAWLLLRAHYRKQEFLP